MKQKTLDEAMRSSQHADITGPLTAWYVNTNNQALEYGDGRKCNVGTTHTVPPISTQPSSRGSRISTCNYGLHASPTLLEAMSYKCPSGQGYGGIQSCGVLWMVEVSGHCDMVNFNGSSFARKGAFEKRKYLIGYKVNGNDINRLTKRMEYHRKKFVRNNPSISTGWSSSYVHDLWKRGGTGTPPELKKIYAKVVQDWLDTLPKVSRRSAKG